MSEEESNPCVICGEKEGIIERSKGYLYCADCFGLVNSLKP